ncbi:hypothetical protein [Chromatium okenii]|uniref:Uncharacterized protein n=1 Tax=Chromatium okenii TaxID=61644 RepID=A0A2S7XRG4_9GAMM|nr:hypothetical protein [Chromatium okenii]PQJ96058.1 hypothetical protein CXB77_09500 [Chromatium okenii]
MIPDLFFLIDHDGTLLDFRARRYSSLYVPPEVFLGKRFNEVLPPEVAALFANKFALHCALMNWCCLNTVCRSQRDAVILMRDFIALQEARDAWQ